MIHRYSSSVSPKGQITLPIEMRRELGIKPKDRVLIEIVDGYIQVTPETSTLESVFASGARIAICIRRWRS